MPCRDYESDHYSGSSNREIRDLKDRLDKVTKLLCYTLDNINNDAWFNGISFRYIQGREPWDKLETELMDWLTDHKRADDEERLRHLEENAKKLRASRILAKLNEEFSEDEIEELKELLDNEEDEDRDFSGGL